MSTQRVNINRCLKGCRQLTVEFYQYSYSKKFESMAIDSHDSFNSIIAIYSLTRLWQLPQCIKAGKPNPALIEEWIPRINRKYHNAPDGDSLNATHWREVSFELLVSLREEDLLSSDVRRHWLVIVNACRRLSHLCHLDKRLRENRVEQLDWVTLWLSRRVNKCSAR